MTPSLYSYAYNALPDQWFWLFPWTCHHTRSHTKAILEEEILWTLGESYCWVNPVRKMLHKMTYDILLEKL